METKKHIVAVTALVKNPAGTKFLLLKRGEHEVAFPGKWAFPGGKAERGETLGAVLKREVLEEAGLELEDAKTYLKDYTFVRPDDQNVIGICFEVKAKSDQIAFSGDFSDACWIGPEELSRYDHIAGMEEEVRLAFVSQMEGVI